MNDSFNLLERLLNSVSTSNEEAEGEAASQLLLQAVLAQFSSDGQDKSNESSTLGAKRSSGRDNRPPGRGYEDGTGTQVGVEDVGVSAEIPDLAGFFAESNCDLLAKPGPGVSDRMPSCSGASLSASRTSWGADTTDVPLTPDLVPYRSARCPDHADWVSRSPQRALFYSVRLHKWAYSPFYGAWAPDVMRPLQDRLGLSSSHIKWIQEVLLNAKVPLRRPFLDSHVDEQLRTELKQPILLKYLLNRVLMVSSRYQPKFQLVDYPERQLCPPIMCKNEMKFALIQHMETPPNSPGPSTMLGIDLSAVQDYESVVDYPSTGQMAQPGEFDYLKEEKYWNAAEPKTHLSSCGAPQEQLCARRGKSPSDSERPRLNSDSSSRTNVSGDFRDGQVDPSPTFHVMDHYNSTNGPTLPRSERFYPTPDSTDGQERFYDGANILAPEPQGSNNNISGVFQDGDIGPSKEFAVNDRSNFTNEYHCQRSERSCPTCDSSDGQERLHDSAKTSAPEREESPVRFSPTQCVEEQRNSANASPIITSSAESLIQHDASKVQNPKWDSGLKADAVFPRRPNFANDPETPGLQAAASDRVARKKDNASKIEQSRCGGGQETEDVLLRRPNSKNDPETPSSTAGASNRVARKDVNASKVEQSRWDGDEKAADVLPRRPYYSENDPKSLDIHVAASDRVAQKEDSHNKCSVGVATPLVPYVSVKRTRFSAAQTSGPGSTVVKNADHSQIVRHALATNACNAKPRVAEDPKHVDDVEIIEVMSGSTDMDPTLPATESNELPPKVSTNLAEPTCNDLCDLKDDPVHSLIISELPTVKLDTGNVAVKVSHVKTSAGTHVLNIRLFPECGNVFYLASTVRERFYDAVFLVLKKLAATPAIACHVNIMIRVLTARFLSCPLLGLKAGLLKHLHGWDRNFSRFALEWIFARWPDWDAFFYYASIECPVLLLHVAVMGSPRIKVQLTKESLTDAMEPVLQGSEACVMSAAGASKDSSFPFKDAQGENPNVKPVITTDHNADNGLRKCRSTSRSWSKSSRDTPAGRESQNGIKISRSRSPGTRSRSRSLRKISRSRSRVKSSRCRSRGKRSRRQSAEKRSRSRSLRTKSRGRTPRKRSRSRSPSKRSRSRSSRRTVRKSRRSGRKSLSISPVRSPGPDLAKNSNAKSDKRTEKRSKKFETLKLEPQELESYISKHLSRYREFIIRNKVVDWFLVARSDTDDSTARYVAVKLRINDKTKTYAKIGPNFASAYVDCLSTVALESELNREAVQRLGTKLSADIFECGESFDEILAFIQKHPDTPGAIKFILDEVDHSMLIPRFRKNPVRLFYLLLQMLTDLKIEQFDIEELFSDKYDLERKYVGSDSSSVRGGNYADTSPPSNHNSERSSDKKMAAEDQCMPQEASADLRQITTGTDSAKSEPKASGSSRSAVEKHGRSSPKMPSLQEVLKFSREAKPKSFQNLLSDIFPDSTLPPTDMKPSIKINCYGDESTWRLEMNASWQSRKNPTGNLDHFFSSSTGVDFSETLVCLIDALVVSHPMTREALVKRGREILGKIFTCSPDSSAIMEILVQPLAQDSSDNLKELQSWAQNVRKDKLVSVLSRSPGFVFHLIFFILDKDALLSKFSSRWDGPFMKPSTSGADRTDDDAGEDLVAKAMSIAQRANSLCSATAGAVEDGGSPDTTSGAIEDAGSLSDASSTIEID